MNDLNELGAVFHRARMQKGLSLDDVYRETKIRERFLQAIEEGNFAEIPGEVYLKGFLRSFSRAVDLNPDDIIAQYNHIAQNAVDSPKKVPAAAPRKKKQAQRAAGRAQRDPELPGVEAAASEKSDPNPDKPLARKAQPARDDGEEGSAKASAASGRPSQTSSKLSGAERQRRKRLPADEELPQIQTLERPVRRESLRRKKAKQLRRQRVIAAWIGIAAITIFVVYYIWRQADWF